MKAGLGRTVAPKTDPSSEARCGAPAFSPLPGLLAEPLLCLDWGDSPASSGCPEPPELLVALLAVLGVRERSYEGDLDADTHPPILCIFTLVHPYAAVSAGEYGAVASGGRSYVTFDTNGRIPIPTPAHALIKGFGYRVVSNLQGRRQTPGSPDHHWATRPATCQGHHWTAREGALRVWDQVPTEKLIAESPTDAT